MKVRQAILLTSELSDTTKLAHFDGEWSRGCLQFALHVGVKCVSSLEEEISCS